MIILMCGLPGGGKTTWARTLESCCDRMVVVCPDDVRSVLLPGGYTFFKPVEEFVWATSKTMARYLLRRGFHVIVDATNTRVSSRASWLQLGDECRTLVHCFWVDLSVDQCVKANLNRDVPVPQAVFDRMLNQFQAPGQSAAEDGTAEVFESVFRFKPDRDRSSSVDEWLSRIGLKARTTEAFRVRKV